MRRTENTHRIHTQRTHAGSMKCAVWMLHIKLHVFRSERQSPSEWRKETTSRGARHSQRKRISMCDVANKGSLAFFHKYQQEHFCHRNKTEWTKQMRLRRNRRISTLTRCQSIAFDSNSIVILSLSVYGWCEAFPAIEYFNVRCNRSRMFPNEQPMNQRNVYHFSSGFCLDFSLQCVW